MQHWSRWSPSCVFRVIRWIVTERPCDECDGRGEVVGTWNFSTLTQSQLTFWKMYQNDKILPLCLESSSLFEHKVFYWMLITDYLIESCCNHLYVQQHPKDLIPHWYLWFRWWPGGRSVPTAMALVLVLQDEVTRPPYPQWNWTFSQQFGLSLVFDVLLVPRSKH